MFDQHLKDKWAQSLSPSEGMAKLNELAGQFAGERDNMLPRALMMLSVYIDSGRNHVFPLMVAHGGLWAEKYFSAPNGPLGKAISYRYFYNEKERMFRWGMLRDFGAQLQEGNKRVFIDTFTSYFYSRLYGAETTDGELKKQVLSRLASVPEAQEKLSVGQRRELYEASLKREQTEIIQPVLVEATDNFDCPVLRTLILKPVLHLSFFPRLRYVFYHNFRSLEERMRRGMNCFDIGESVGWNNVEASIEAYKKLPDNYKMLVDERKELIYSELAEIV